MTRARIALLTCLLAVVSLSQACGDELLPTTNRAQGTVADEKLLKEKPAKGYITDAKEFEKLWKAWCGDKKMPEIDFDKEMVLVVASSMTSVVGIIPMLDSRGNLTVTYGAGQRAKDAKGFDYVIATVNKKGIKTINETKKEPDKLKLAQSWRGEVSDAALIKKRPEGGLIADDKALEDLWKAWSVKGDIPKVDFKKDFIVVVADKTCMPIDLILTLSDKGDLKAEVGVAALLKDKGFGYLIGVLPRDKIKSYHGTPLDAK